jgi:ankyrin repeat protein
MRAATWADLEVVKLIVLKGADVNARCKNGRSPLVMAAWCFAQITQRHGCGNGQNMDLLMPAAMRRSLQVVKFLLDQGAEVNPKNEMEDSPLTRAVAEGNLEVVKLLNAHGAKE